MKNIKPLPKLVYTKVWATSNTGILWDIEPTKARAIKSLERSTGKPWNEIQSYCEVRKVTVVEGW